MPPEEEKSILEKDISGINLKLLAGWFVTVVTGVASFMMFYYTTINKYEKKIQDLYNQIQFFDYRLKRLEDERKK